jgi:hypothetical protein
MVGYLLLHYSLRDFGKGLEHFFNFYPEKVQTIDSYFSDSETFKYGISDDYWTARQVTMFSKKGIRLYCAFDGGTPWLHASNHHWFTDNNTGKHAHCKFTFLLWSKDKEIPEFFRITNPELEPIELYDWNLYYVVPYRYMMQGTRLSDNPVLIDSTAHYNKSF